MSTAQTVFAILSAAATVLASLAGLLWWVFRQGRNAGIEEARREAGLQAQADATAKVTSLEARLTELQIELDSRGQSAAVPDSRMPVSATSLASTGDVYTVPVPMITYGLVRQSALDDALNSFRESVTLGAKHQRTSTNSAETVASLADMGGIVLVGVKDKDASGEERIVSVLGVLTPVLNVPEETSHPTPPGQR